MGTNNLSMIWLLLIGTVPIVFDYLMLNKDIFWFVLLVEMIITIAFIFWLYFMLFYFILCYYLPILQLEFYNITNKLSSNLNTKANFYFDNLSHSTISLAAYLSSLDNNDSVLFTSSFTGTYKYLRFNDIAVVNVCNTKTIVKNMYGSQSLKAMLIINTKTTPNAKNILYTLKPYTLPGNIFDINPPVFVCKNVSDMPHKNDATKHKIYDFW